MNKSIRILLLLLLFTSSTFAQNEQEVRDMLENINSLNQIDSLKIAHPTWDIGINRTVSIGFFSDSIIINTKIGGICKASDINNSGTYLYKIMEQKKEEHCKVQYIFFLGADRNMVELDSIRSIVLEKYANGIDFKTLHDQYNEDGSSTGLLDWFCRGILAKDFDTAVFPKKKNEIFKVDVTEVPWHYIVLKLEKNKLMNVTYSLRVQINN